jgi:hypothetical protein
MLLGPPLTSDNDEEFNNGGQDINTVEQELEEFMGAI